MTTPEESLVPETPEEDSAVVEAMDVSSTSDDEKPGSSSEGRTTSST